MDIGSVETMLAATLPERKGAIVEVRAVVAFLLLGIACRGHACCCMQPIGIACRHCLALPRLLLLAANRHRV